MKPWEYRPKPPSLPSGGKKPPSDVPKLGDLEAWFSEYPHLHVKHPNGLILNAKPHHVSQAAETHSWAILYSADMRVLTRWGNVPSSALLDLRDLETGEPLITEQAAA